MSEQAAFNSPLIHLGSLTTAPRQGDVAADGKSQAFLWLCALKDQGVSHRGGVLQTQAPPKLREPQQPAPSGTNGHLQGGKWPPQGKSLTFPCRRERPTSWGNIPTLLPPPDVRRTAPTLAL